MIGFAWNILLGLAWVALTGNFSGPNLFMGLLLGYLSLAMIQSQLSILDGYAQRVPRVIGFGFFFIGELIKANLRVAQDIMRPEMEKAISPGVIAFPLEARSDVEITFLANAISLTPGTLSLDVSDDRRVLYIHAMYMADEAALLEDIKNMERRVLRILR
ncbi:multisubunit sodium/proton antiporter MrpE subunit [Alkalispirillum mobile]|uniref:Multisubunit sodium/proton antiporter MrpE subunit n=1 Tax=Alkalispirillum mobile TaxID=85925 RepID=A0A498BXP6_9GAMM|nr:Na+/H+ antiporter subunit E [Alkalispirillum mobile]RLK48564.1 multisubunit sodium/proton antiporter MrpE subunit [Alkalispirillum mobile]